MLYIGSQRIPGVRVYADGESYATTFILEDEAGNEVVGVLVDEEEIFDATANDIRLGTTAATDSGVTEGTKEIPAYHTVEGHKIITAGSACVIPIPQYDYTRLQVIVCEYNTNLSDSVAANKVVIDDNVYDCGSTESKAVVTKEANGNIGNINLNILNNSNKSCVLRYILYKEIK